MLATYGLRSRERTCKYNIILVNILSSISIAIDEEFTSQMKLIEADLKRMQSILISYVDQKTDLSKEEKNEREYVIKLLREALKMLRHEFEHQTKQF